MAALTDRGDFLVGWPYVLEIDVLPVFPSPNGLLLEVNVHLEHSFRVKNGKSMG